MLKTALAAAVTVACLAAPTGATAAAFYVAQDGTADTQCFRFAPCSLERAIALADASQNRDTIHIRGAFRSEQQVVDLRNSPIDLVGSGDGDDGTVLLGVNPPLRVGSSSSARDVKVVTNWLCAAYVLAGGSLVEVNTEGPGAGVCVGGASTTPTVLELVTADHTSVGLWAEQTSGSRVVVRSSRLSGVLSNGTGDTVVERCRLDGSQLLQANSGHVRIVDSLLTTSYTGLVVQGGAQVELLGSTLIGSNARAAGVQVQGTQSTPTLVQASIVRGFGRDLQGTTQDGALVARSSDFATTAGTITDGGANTHADPMFVDAAAGDFRLRAGSPAIDREAASRASLLGDYDFAGAPRVVDGDGDGTALPDMGAFEHGYEPPVIPSDPAPSDGGAAPAAPPAGGQSPAATDGAVQPGAGDPPPAPPAPSAPPAPPAAKAPVAPRLTLMGGRLPVDARGRAVLTVLSTTATRATLTISRPGKKALVVATATRTLRPGMTTVRVPLSVAGRALLGRGVTVTATAPGARRASARMVLPGRRPAHRR